MTPTLKRGHGLSFYGTNWKLASDHKWESGPHVPYYGEPLVGERFLNGVKHLVFQCKDDSFLAQPEDICNLPIPSDPMEVISPPPDQLESEEKSIIKKQKSQAVKQALVFVGKNWKLASDRKWSNTNGFVSGDPIGSRMIKDNEYDVYKNGDGFIAIKRN